MLDLNGLKEINDTEGHATGDGYIVGVSRLLQSTFRPTDELARWGGDEFAILMESDEDPSEKVQKRLKTISDPTLRFSAGIYTIPTQLLYEEARDNHLFGSHISDSIRIVLNEKVQLADKLMYEAKRQAKVKSGGFAKPTVILRQTEIKDASE